MKLVSITWARNESDILEAFVRYHCAFLDAMIIVDHGSDDNSVEILMHLQKEGLPLEIRRSHHLDHRQNATLTVLMNEVAHRGYDWVLPLDADEFIRITPGTSLRSALASCDTHTPLSVPWRTYVPTVNDSQDPHPLKRIQHRRSVEYPQYAKLFVPSRLLREGSFSLSYGSHALFNTAVFPPLTVPAVSLPSFCLAHFPVRSADQLARKAFGGWLSHILRNDKRPGEVWHWKLFYERCSDGQPISSEELQTFATEYASEYDGPVTLIMDPLPIPDSAQHLRYPSHVAPPLRVLTRAAERMAESLSSSCRISACPRGSSPSLDSA